MGELFRTWWPVMLLMWLPSVVQSVMSVWIARAFRRLDESHPDDMPMTAGEWLQGELARLGLGDRLGMIVTDKDAKASLDAYHPHHRVIQLTAETHFKRDPMHWAIAAHELGHARFRLSLPFLSRFLISMRSVKHALIATALAMLFGNVMFALPHITPLAYRLLEAAIALHALVLLDEFVASTLALRSLRASPAFGPRQMRSARRVLTLAFSTYAIAYATRIAMLSQWHLVEEHTRTPAVPPTYTLTTLGTIGAVVATIIAAGFAVDRIRVALRKNSTESARETILKVLFQLAMLGFVHLVWNHRADASWGHYVMAALIPIAGWFRLILGLPGVILDFVIFDRITRRLLVDPTDRTDELRQDHVSIKGMRDRKHGNAAFNVLMTTAEASPAIEARARELLRLTFVPLVIAFWMS